MSWSIVSTMKQVTQGSIIQRMTINSILIRITEIVGQDVLASIRTRGTHLDSHIK